MVRITIRLGTKFYGKPSLLCFRLRDGRTVDLFYRSGIKMTLEEYEKYDRYGEVRPKMRTYSKETADNIKKEKDLMLRAYDSLCNAALELKSSALESEMRRIRTLFEAVPCTFRKSITMASSFHDFFSKAYSDGLIGESRRKHYATMLRKLERFLTYKGLAAMEPAGFGPDLLMDFRNFLANERKIAGSCPQLYSSLKKNSIPSKGKGVNSVVSDMKMMQAYFACLEDKGEIDKSPFKSVGTERKKLIMRTKYDIPVFLKKEEFLKIRDTQAPVELQDVKDAFVLQCFLGCRIGDFKRLSVSDISISEEGFPYVHYLPQKTRKSQPDNSEVQTPVLPSAIEIIRRTGFALPVLRKLSGAGGYNEKIRSLLEYCGISRKVPLYDSQTGDNFYLPVFKIAGSKLCRKTFVDMMAKVQVNLYAAGLHKEGSDAVKRYTHMELKDRYILMCAAFGETPECK